jgi:hypothetical protein
MKMWEMADTYSCMWLMITLYVQCIRPKLYRDPWFGLSVFNCRLDATLLPRRRPRTMRY